MSGASLALGTLFLQPDERELLRGIESVKLQVLSLDKGNRSLAVDRLRRANYQLGKQGWRKLKVAKNPVDQVVNMFAHGSVREGVDAVAITILDGSYREAIVVYATGSMSEVSMQAVAARLRVNQIRQRTAP